MYYIAGMLLTALAAYGLGYWLKDLLKQRAEADRASALKPLPHNHRLPPLAQEERTSFDKQGELDERAESMCGTRPSPDCAERLKKAQESLNQAESVMRADRRAGNGRAAPAPT